MNTAMFKDELIDYLSQEKQFIEADIQAHQSMPDSQKVNDGFMIEDAEVINCWDGNCYEMETVVNFTRLRPGDHVEIVDKNGRKSDARIIENDILSVSLFCQTTLNMGDCYNIYVVEAYLLDPLLQVLTNIVSGAPGYSFLSQVACDNPVSAVGSYPFALNTIQPYLAGLNTEQANSCIMVSQNPSISCLQGPPGTGKTRTLAAAVNMIGSQGQQSLVIALTHQAVNNALNQIHKANPNLPIVKIGDTSKAQKLDPSIGQFPSMKAYRDSLSVTSRSGRVKHNRSPRGLVMGMTFHAAVINFGLQHHRCVFPTYLFMDEASQMPMPYASVLGAFGAGSICLFGDSRQMPPIFHPNLVGHKYAVSMLDYCTSPINAPSTTLTTTYRMNSQITQFVSDHYYKPFGVTLNTMNNTPPAPNCFSWCDTLSLPFALDTCTEQNEVEADAIANEVVTLLNNGVKPSDIAIITPYRKQALQLRYSMYSLGVPRTDIPLTDTVERLQGQDVEYIFISFATSTRLSFLSKEQIDFLLDKNRLNVMISRAKSFVRIYSTQEIWNRIK